MTRKVSSPYIHSMKSPSTIIGIIIIIRGNSPIIDIKLLEWELDHKCDVFNICTHLFGGKPLPHSLTDNILSF